MKARGCCVDLLDLKCIVEVGVTVAMVMEVESCCSGGVEGGELHSSESLKMGVAAAMKVGGRVSTR